MIRPSVVLASEHRARILKWMLRLGVSHQDVAEAGRLDPDSLRHFLHARRSHSNPTCERVAKIYAALEVLRARQNRMRIQNENKEPNDLAVRKPDRDAEHG